MQITKIQSNYITNTSHIGLQKKSEHQPTNNASVNTFAKIPAGFRYNANINFGSSFDPNRTVPDINFEDYKAMSENTKKRYRLIYKSFSKNPFINKDELYKPAEGYMPLQDEKLMDEFIKTSSLYNKFKDQPIICLGRSPKWFLNTSLWMKDGIDKYNFVAFSKYWYRPDEVEGVVKNRFLEPNEKEIKAYRKYLKRIQADPKTIVDNFEKNGKKTVITDYICSGKGACSFLDLMSNYADDLGILEKFSKAIQIVGIGSREYMEELDPISETISDPKVPLPEKLIPYSKNIKQEFHNMNYMMFREMLLNENTNECRSTYYPHDTWTIYKPDQFKTGLISDIKKIKKMVKQLGKDNEKSMVSFTPAMADFRNLLNFRILDGLSTRDLLKSTHISRI